MLAILSVNIAPLTAATFRSSSPKSFPRVSKSCAGSKRSLDHAVADPRVMLLIALSSSGSLAFSICSSDVRIGHFDIHGQNERGKRLARFIESQRPRASAFQHIVQHEVEGSDRRYLVADDRTLGDGTVQSTHAVDSHLISNDDVVVLVERHH